MLHRQPPYAPKVMLKLKCTVGLDGGLHKKSDLELSPAAVKRAVGTTDFRFSPGPLSVFHLKQFSAQRHRLPVFFKGLISVFKLKRSSLFSSTMTN